MAAAVLPTAPLLVPGVSAVLPDGIAPVCDAIDAVVEALSADLVVALAAGDGTVYGRAAASLEGIGRGDIVADARVDAEAAAAVSHATNLRLDTDSPLPLGLAVLALRVRDIAPVVAITVPATASFAALTRIGAAIANALPLLRVAVVAAGDLSAGLTQRSPLYVVSGAVAWDEQALAAVDGGRLYRLGRLGPEEAQRVGAQAWAPLAVLHGAACKLRVAVRHYSAPRGVGYLVASSA